MEQNIVVFFVNDWKMDSGKTGCTVNYFFLDANGRIPVAVAGVSGPAGYQRAKASLESSERPKFITVPGKYLGRFEMTVGSDGKPVLQLKEILEYVCPMYLTDKNPFTLEGHPDPEASVDAKPGEASSSSRGVKK